MNYPWNQSGWQYLCNGKWLDWIPGGCQVEWEAYHRAYQFRHPSLMSP